MNKVQDRPRKTCRTATPPNPDRNPGQRPEFSRGAGGAAGGAGDIGLSHPATKARPLPCEEKPPNGKPRPKAGVFLRERCGEGAAEGAGDNGVSHSATKARPLPCGEKTSNGKPRPKAGVFLRERCGEGA